MVITVSSIAYPLPDFSRAKKIHQDEQHNYMNSFNASAAIGMNAHLFNRITGVVFVYSGEKRYPISDSDKKVNIGLQLKHFKQVLFFHHHLIPSRNLKFESNSR